MPVSANVMSTVRRPRARRVSSHPLLGPGAAPGYGPIFNAGLLHHGGRFHLFARGVRDGYRRNPGEGARFLDYVSDVLLFRSDDGLRYTFDHVLLASDGDAFHAIEDPRVQRVSSCAVGGGTHADHLVMTYTRLSHPDSGRPWQIGAHRLVEDGDRLVVDPSSACILGPEGIHDKDGVVFNLSDGRVALLHRVHPDMQVAVFDDLEHLWNADALYWRTHLDQIERHTIIRPTPGSLGVGAGAPPLVCEAGLLLFFHERRSDGVYTMKVALLDPASGEVRSMLPDALLEPEMEWERFGDVENVVFVQGVHRLDDGQIYLTYGAADRCVGAAIVHEGDLLDAFARRGA